MAPQKLKILKWAAPLFFSVVAIVISLFALHVSYSNLEVSRNSLEVSKRSQAVGEEANRPQLLEERVEVLRTTWETKDRIGVSLFFVVKNVGKSGAVVHSQTDAPVDVDVFNESNDCKVLEIRDQWRVKNMVVIPNDHFGIPVTVIVSRGCEKRRQLVLQLTVDLYYENQVTGTPYHQRPMAISARFSPD